MQQTIHENIRYVRFASIRVSLVLFLPVHVIWIVYNGAIASIHGIFSRISEAAICICVRAVDVVSTVGPLVGLLEESIVDSIGIVV